jgi:serine/threonine-protein kinase
MEPGGIQIGAVLAGRYRVERVLGQGGMGLVVQAMHLQLHQPVAMKFLLPEVLANQQVVQRFLREAQAAVRLRSEHVARVIDVGSLETGAPYMVLEYLDGADLSSFPRTHLTVGGVVDLMLQACEALAEAHSLGIVHRDIKPANFFITRGPGGAPLLKVLDFGISKTPTTGGQLTATQAVMGTPAYMSPEQMRSSRDVDHRSDIWSLGVVLYELLQGAPPYGGDTFSSLVLQVVNEPLPRLTVALPGDLAGIIYRCLEKDPARRFQNIAELAQALAKYAQSETQAAISVQRTRGIVGTEPPRAALEPGPAHRALPSTLSGSAGARTRLPRGGRRWPIVAAMGVVTGAIVIAIVVMSGGSSTETPLPSAQPEGAQNATAEPRPPIATQPNSPPPPVATQPSSPPPPVAPQPSSPPTTSSPTVAAAPAPASPPVTPPAPGPVATTPSAPVPAVPQPNTAAAPSQTAPPPLAVTPPAPSAAETPPSTTAKKSRKTKKAAASSAKPGIPPTAPPASRAAASSAKPGRPPAQPPASDDVLGARN